MAEYEEWFSDKKPTKVGRDKVTCIMGLVLALCINHIRLEMEDNGRDHHNFFNGLITKVNYLDDIIDVFLEAERLKK